MSVFLKIPSIGPVVINQIIKSKSPFYCIGNILFCGLSAKKLMKCKEILHIVFTNRSQIGVFNIGTVFAY
jgi:hypothetical protein